MFKKLISPFQKNLLEKRLCVACTSPLDKAKRLGKLSERRDLVQCKCSRRYTYNKELVLYILEKLKETNCIGKINYYKPGTFKVGKYVSDGRIAVAKINKQISADF